MRALGEIGLDYHYEDFPRELQRKAFAQQLELAVELDVPVIVHDRDAHQDTLELLKKYRPKGMVKVLFCIKLRIFQISPIMKQK